MRKRKYIVRIVSNRTICWRIHRISRAHHEQHHKHSEMSRQDSDKPPSDSPTHLLDRTAESTSQNLRGEFGAFCYGRGDKPAFGAGCRDPPVGSEF